MDIISNYKRTLFIIFSILSLVLLVWYVIAASPTHSNPILNTTLGFNTTTENLTIYNVSTADSDNDSITNIISWYQQDYSKLILYYEFEGGTNATYAKDYSGRGFDAVGQNIVFENSSDGRNFGVANFSTTNWNTLIRYYNASGSGNLRFNDSYTIEVRYKARTGATIVQNLITKTSGTGFQVAEFRIMLRPSGQIWATVGNGTDSTTIQTSLTIYGDGQWHDLFFMFDRSQNRTVLFIDNSEVGNRSGLFGFRNIYHTANPIVIGQVYTPTGFTHNFNGSIAYVRIWNGTLSAEQMRILSSNQTNLLDNSILAVGQVWNVSITPNDKSTDGTTRYSTNLTIRGNPIQQEIPILNTTYGGNNTDENLSTYNVSVVIMGTSEYVKPIVTWFKNSVPMFAYNFPFEAASSSTSTVEFVSHDKGIATIIAGAAYNSTRGYDGNGTYIFNGVNQSILITNTISTLRENISFEFWFNKTGDGSPESNRLYLISKGNGTSSGVGIWIDNSNNRIYAAINGTYFNGTSVVNNNTWNYVVFSVNRTNATLYVNNKNEASGGHTGISSLTVNMTIAVSENLTGNYLGFFNGSIDEVRIWNATITSDQVLLGELNKSNVLDGRMIGQGDIMYGKITVVTPTREGETRNSNNLMLNWYNITLISPANGTSLAGISIVNIFNVTTAVSRCRYYNNDTASEFVIRANNTNVAENHNVTINRTDAPGPAVINILYNIECMTRGNTTFFAPQNYTIHIVTPVFEFFQPVIANTTSYVRNNVTFNISCGDRIDIQRYWVNVTNSSGAVIFQFINTSVGGLGVYDPLISVNFSNNASGTYGLQAHCANGVPNFAYQNVSFYYGFLNASFVHPQTPSNASFLRNIQTINVTVGHISNNVSTISIYIDGENRTICSSQLWCNLTLNVTSNLSIGVHGFNATVTDIWGNINVTVLRNFSTHLNYTVNDTIMNIRFANETAFVYDVAQGVAGFLNESRYRHNATIFFNNSDLQNMSSIIYVFPRSRLTNSFSTRDIAYDNATVDGTNVNVTWSVYTNNITFIVNRTASDGLLQGTHYFAFDYSFFQEQTLSALNITEVRPPTPANRSFITGIQTFNYTTNVTNSAILNITIFLDNLQQTFCAQDQTWCNLTINVSTLSVGVHGINATVYAEDGAINSSSTLNFSTSLNYTINESVMGTQFGIEQAFVYGTVPTVDDRETRYRHNGTINVTTNATQNLSSIIYLFNTSRLTETFSNRNTGFDHAEVDGDTTNVTYSVYDTNVTIIVNRSLNQGIHYFQFNYSTYAGGQTGGGGGGGLGTSRGTNVSEEEVEVTYPIDGGLTLEEILVNGGIVSTSDNLTMILLNLQKEYIRGSSISFMIYTFEGNTSVELDSPLYVTLVNDKNKQVQTFVPQQVLIGVYSVNSSLKLFNISSLFDKDYYDNFEWSNPFKKHPTGNYNVSVIGIINDQQLFVSQHIQIVKDIRSVYEKIQAFFYSLDIVFWSVVILIMIVIGYIIKVTIYE